MTVQLRLDLPHEAGTVSFCRDIARIMLDHVGIEADRAAEIELAVSAAAGSVVRHASPRPGQRYQLALAFCAGRVCLQIVDQGRGFIESVVAEPAPEQGGGQGLGTIEQLADVLTFSATADGGCRLEAEFFVSPPPLGPASLHEEPPESWLILPEADDPGPNDLRP